jgi:predicted aldo/keto reductase-like oxidoreductase
MDSDLMKKSLENSLERLNTDYLDLVQIHGISYSKEQADEILSPGGTLDSLENLKDDGLTRFIGFSSEDNNEAVYRFVESKRFDVMQICYNFAFQHPYVPSRPFGSLYEAEQRDMGIVAMRTPTSGTFQKWIQRVNPQNTFDYTGALIQFVLSNPLIDVALIGMRTPARVKQNAKLCDNRNGRIDIGELYKWYV